MTLNIGGLGIIKPYVKFNARSGKWLMRGLDGQDVEIECPVFLADLANIATGWLRFQEGQAPERVMDPSLSEKAPCPGRDFKRGFVVLLYSPKWFGGIAEFASSSVHVCNAIRELYSDFKAIADQHPSQAPVISYTGADAMKDRLGTNYRPIFKIGQWVNRPAVLPDRSPVEPSEIWHGHSGPAPSARAAAHYVPPPPKAVVDDPLF